MRPLQRWSSARRLMAAKSPAVLDRSSSTERTLSRSFGDRNNHEAASSSSLRSLWTYLQVESSAQAGLSVILRDKGTLPAAMSSLYSLHATFW